MSLTTIKLASALIILLVTIIGGLWPFLKKSRQTANCECGSETNDFPSGEALTAGIFLGEALLHMLPDAAKDFIKAGYDYPYPFLLAAISFILLLLLEHISVTVSHKINTAVTSIVLLTVVMLSIHSLFEGAAVGISTNFATMFIIILAILAHKGAASFALSINLNRSNLNFLLRFCGFTLFAIMTPIGILTGNWVITVSNNNTLLTPIFSSLAAGTFLYIGTLHGLDRASLIKHCCNIKEFLFMLVGFTTMAVVAIWA